MGLSDAALQCLLYANGLRRGHGATKRDYAASLRALLDRDASMTLAIPGGLDRGRGPSLPPRSRSPVHRPPSVSPGPRRTSPDPRGAPQGAGAPNAPPPSPRRPPSPSSRRDARARRQSDQQHRPVDADADIAALQRLRPVLATAEHVLAECARFLRALPPGSAAAQALASDAERASDLVRSAHGGMAAGALAESLRVASETRRSYADVCGGGAPVAPPANVIHVSRPPTWPGAAPGPALRSPMRPGPAWTVCLEPAQPMLLGFRQDASSFGPKLRMHVRRPHGSKPLSNLQRIFLVKNSEIWQGFLRAR